MAVVGLGMSLFFVGQQPRFRTAPDPLTGNLLALISGFTWALTLAGLRWIGSRQSMATVAAGNALACLICLPNAMPVAVFSLSDLVVIGYLGAFQIGLAYFFLTRGMRTIPAVESSLLLLAEPALNPVWAGLVHGERPTAPAVAGGALILSAALARTLVRK
jgi:drug/metabolite transporter (DMT)-like permease